VLVTLLVLMVTLGNFALGFGLAVHMGHGPAGLELPDLEQIRRRLRTLLRIGA